MANKIEKAEWGLLVYMAADNDLKTLADTTLQQLAALGSRSVRICVQKDTGTVERHVFAGGRKPSRLVPLPETEGGFPAGKTINMGSSKTLKEFIEWARGTCQFKKTALVVWNHGGATLGLDKGSRGDFLSNKELKQALENQAVDLVGCDACLTGTIELANELSGREAFYVAPETHTPAAGWPYQLILEQLMGTPEMDPAQLAQVILNSFATSAPADNTSVLGAWRLQQVPVLTATIDKLGKALSACSAYGLPLSAARARMILMEDPDYVDLGSFISELEKIPEPSIVTANRAAALKARQELFAAAGECRAALKQAKVDVRPERGLSGLSILFPALDSYGVRSRLKSSGSGSELAGSTTTNGSHSPLKSFRALLAGLSGAPRWRAFLKTLLPAEQDLPGAPPKAYAGSRRPPSRRPPASSATLR